MARRSDQAGGEAIATGQVPPEFAEMFAGVSENELGARLVGWMDRRYGSGRAYLYWLVELAAKADRETVRLDAITQIVTMLHGDAPQEVILTARREVEAHAGTGRLTPTERTPAILGILQRVGALPAAARAISAGGGTYPALEQVPGADSAP